MSGLPDLGLAGLVASIVSGFFVWLSRLTSIRATTLSREDAELKAYRQELRDDLEAARVALDAVKTDRIALLEKNAIDRIRMEERVATLEHEKSGCLEKLAEMARKLEDLQGEVIALRRMIGVGSGVRPA